MHFIKSCLLGQYSFLWSKILCHIKNTIKTHFLVKHYGRFLFHPFKIYKLTLPVTIWRKSPISNNNKILFSNTSVFKYCISRGLPWLRQYKLRASGVHRHVKDEDRIPPWLYCTIGYRREWRHKVEKGEVKTNIKKTSATINIHKKGKHGLQ